MAGVVRLFLAIFAGLGGVGGWGLLTALIILSHQGGWRVMVDFNRFGEGPLEIVLFPAIAILSALGVYLYFFQSPSPRGSSGMS